MPGGDGGDGVGGTKDFVSATNMNGTVKAAERHQPFRLMVVLVDGVVHLFVQVSYVTDQRYVQSLCDALGST